MKKTTNAAPPADLPPGVLAGDLKWPKYDEKNRRLDSLTFLNVTNFGWCLATLAIGGGGRTYAARVSDGAVVRVGKGPHVLRTIEVHVTEKRAKAGLQKYLDLKVKSLSDAGVIRDRISSRRAEGQLRRGRGELSWRWDV